MAAILTRRGGGRAYRPGAAAPDGGRKLSSNELPFEPVPAVLDAMARVSLRTYPDHRASALRESLAAVHEVSPASIAVGAGSVGLIQQLCLAFTGPGDVVAFPWPSFEAYPVMAAIAGAATTTAPLRYEAADLHELRVCERTRLVFVADPNNPTGTTVDADAFDRLCERVPRGCLVVLDRAYAEFVTAADAVDEREILERHSNVAILRTFSKAHGLAALRVGWMIGPPEVVEAVDRVLVPFAVSAVAQAAALASLDATEDVAQRAASVVAERDRLARELRMRGVPVADAQGNFVWVPGHALEPPGIATRVFPEGTRITAGSPDDVDALLDAIDVPTSDAPRRAQQWIDRLDAVERRLTTLVDPRSGLTAADPATGEQWDHGQVWAHNAEFGAYWLDELDRVVDGSATFGRTKADTHRIASIAEGRAVDPRVHAAAFRRAAARTRRVLAGLDDHAWQARSTHQTLGTMDLDAFLQHFLVGHWEEHAEQLEALG